MRRAPRSRCRSTVTTVITVTAIAAVTAMSAATALLASAPTLAWATPPADAVVAAPKSLEALIDNIRDWLVGLLVALATLFLTVGGIRYLLAGSNPAEVARAKDTLKYAAIGFAVAALAPLLVTILQKLVE